MDNKKAVSPELIQRKAYLQVKRDRVMFRDPIRIQQVRVAGYGLPITMPQLR